ncbi:MAG TPA: MoxR family ATPase [Armatimonadota bacterium]|jgi:MoxR-like ATPase|nr:MoxR family ATPase [Armatimonadota bacterium]HOM72749.1 MoxR family ATPase [Armatimonadota bacterium]HOP80790.1 MoxR family ATPase [Armatimonadota bacterium]
MQIEERIGKFRQDFNTLKAEISRMIVGQEEIVEGVIVCLLADGHALLEGVPGLGKTLLVRTLAQAMDLKFSRIQFTPDLMPADIVGTNILIEDDSGRRCFQFQPGPVFANIILADEINRATPKTQSAMLEAMQEHSVTVAGDIRKLQEPFLVLATQNPIEMEGTYPLPEAQLDRFLFKLMVSFPTLDELGTILDRTTKSEQVEINKVTNPETVLEMRRLAREVELAPHIKEFALKVVLATHPDSEYATDMVKRFVRYGSSPRGAQALALTSKVNALLDDRRNVGFDDIKKVAKPALWHRIILNFEGEAEGISTDAIVADILEKVTQGDEIVV